MGTSMPQIDGIDPAKQDRRAFLRSSPGLRIARNEST